MRRISAYAIGASIVFGGITVFSPVITFDAWEIAQRAPMIIAATPTKNVTVAAAVPVPAPISAPPPAAAHAKPGPIYPLSLDLKIENGDTLTSILTDAGVSYDEAQRVVAAVHRVYNVHKLNAGQNIALRLDKNPGSPDHPLLTSLSLPVSAFSVLHLARQGNSFAARITDVPLQRKLTRTSNRIESSLYQTGADAGIPPALIDQIINAYSYDVDFQRDIKPGDRLDVLFEQMQTESGKAAGHGNILFADLTLSNGRDLKIYRYVDKDGNAGYYNEKGENIRKALLRTPIPGARITSGYGMRFHPILGYTRMHRGVDFGAPIGTPIYAAGDGVIKVERREHGYGNFILLQHNRTYSTAYAHISHFASGIHVGSHVKQGQVIAYVGETGLATGPHLHFEVRVNGVQVNPANVRFKTGVALQGRELAAFRTTVRHINEQLASLPAHDDGTLAMNVQ